MMLNTINKVNYKMNIKGGIINEKQQYYKKIFRKRGKYQMIDIEKYLNNTYKTKKVIHRYKIYDHNVEKRYWQQWEKEMKKRIKDSSYDIDWNDDNGWMYED